MEPIRCMRWLQAVGRDDLTAGYINKNSYVCGLHFSNGVGPTLAEPDPIKWGQRQILPSTVLPTLPKVSDESVCVTTTVTSTTTTTTTTTASGHCFSTPITSLAFDNSLLDDIGSGLFGHSNRHGKKKTPGKDSSLSSPKISTLFSPYKLISPMRLPRTLDKLATPSKRSADIFMDASPSPRKKVCHRPIKTTPIELKKAKKRCSEKEQENEISFNKDGLIMYSVGTQVEPHMTARMSYEQCLPDHDHFEFFCGVSVDKFNHLYNSLGGDAVVQYLKYRDDKGTPKKIKAYQKKISLRGRLFLTLVRLRRAFTEKELGYFFGISESTVSRICKAFIQLMFLELGRLKPFRMPSAQAQQATRPVCFDSYQNCRCVVDCLELRMQRPSDFGQQGNCYSDYKSSVTAKVLVAITLRGAFCFISEAYEGSASDKQIFLECGLVDLLEPGDGVMVDRGFLVEKELKSRGVSVIIPPFKDPQQSTFTGIEVLSTRKVANARIHVERLIGKIRNWRITCTQIPQSFIPFMSQIVFVCGALTNYQRVDL